MAKGMNLLHQVFEKSWKLYDEQMSKIFDEATAIYDWINEVIPAADEALNKKAICKLPKTPNVKRRRIDETADESTSSENGGQELIEAKKPRKLKPRKNAKTTKRRSSKSRQSKQSQKNLQDVGKQGRVTRASCRNETFEIHDRNQVLEKDISLHDDVFSKEARDSTLTQLNSTKSFMEHEKDFESSEEKLVVKLNDIFLQDVNEEFTESIKTETCKKELDTVDDGKMKNDVDDDKSPAGGHLMNDKEVEIRKIVENIDSLHNDLQSAELKGAEEKMEIKLNEEQNETVPDNQLECVDKKQGGDEAEMKEVAIEGKDQEANEKKEQGKETEVNSPRMVYPQGKIAKIKERLFEKIVMPTSSTPTRQSPRLAAERNSPRVGKFPPRNDTPNKTNSPLRKRKVIELLVLDDESVSDEGRATQERDNDENVDSANKDSQSGDLVCMGDAVPGDEGTKIIKGVKPKNLIVGVHSMIKGANQKKDSIFQGPVIKQGNIVTNLATFLKTNANEKKPETVQERKQRLEEETKKREKARTKLIQQAEQRRQKEIEERKKRRQEREQRVAEAQAKRAQEEKEKQEITQKRFEMMKKNEEKIRKNKEKEEELKKRMREKKMAEAEAKRKQEESERLAKMAEKEEEERRKAEYHQRKQEYEEMERKRKIEEQKRAEEQRLEEHAKEIQLQEERLRREIEEREAQVRKRLEEKEKEMKEIQERKRIEKEKQEREEQERIRKEALERERLEKEKAERERAERELMEKMKREEAKETERKLKEEKEREAREKELKERKEREMKLAKEKELKEREAYFRKKLEEKKLAETKRTFDKAELEMKQTMMKSPAHPAPHSSNSKIQKVQCTSYNTPTLEKTKPKKIAKSPSLQNYDIDNLSEDDSTDDEDDPAQNIPSWAKGTNFKTAILAQIHSEIDPHEIFVNMLEPPKLEKMFPRLRPRFFKRTSSACWDHPPRPFKTML